MKRWWFLGIAALLYATGGYAQADYVLIKLNLGSKRPGQGQPGPGQPGVGQFGGVAGFPGFPGQPGGVPGGVVGAAGAAGVAGAAGGFPMPPGGVLGNQGGRPPGAGMIGAAGGFPPGGAAGAAGVAGVFPPGGAPGAAGMIGAAGGFPPGGAAGAAGNLGGRPPGGVIGAAGGFPPAGAAGVAGAAGAAGGFPMPPGGAMGNIGGRPPGGVLGAGGGFPPGGAAGAAGGFPPGGAVGAAGGFPPGGAVGAAGGFPPGGAFGNPGFPPGGFGNQGGRPGGSGAVEDDTLSISMYALIEVKDARKMRSGRLQIDHKWGSTVLYTLPGALEVTPVKLPTVKERYETQLKERIRGGKPTEKQLEDLAEWALAHGLLNEFTDLMHQLGDLNAANKAAVAFKQVETAISKPITKGESTEIRKMLGARFKMKPPSRHYVLYYDAKEERPDIDARLRRLEENYKAFFYWFALKGIALRPPDKRLVAVLIDEPGAFKDWRRRFDTGPLVADGFYARRENVAFFSAQRLDEAYDAMNKATKEMWRQGWDAEKLLSSNKQDAKSSHPPKATNEQIAYAQTIALLLKALQEESEVASVTHEGTRQLLAAAGLKPGTVLLPRGVAAPEWIQFGMGSFFETPEGAPWMGTGAPSWSYMVTFDVMKTNDKLDPPDQALRKVITDEYFHESVNGRIHSALVKARTMSWSLTYYLARKRLDGLVRYYEELENLPRDLDFDSEVLLGCFGRAFGLMQEANPRQIDESKLQDLAKDWYQTIKDTPLEIDEARKDAVKAAREREKKRDGGGVPRPPPAPGVGLPGRPGY
jgi:hypothetical protein